MSLKTHFDSSCALFLLFCVCALTSGCELTEKDNDSNDTPVAREILAKMAAYQQGSSGESNTSGTSLVGTWSLTDASGFTWFIHFGSDGNWKITNDKGGAERRVYGSYSSDGNSFSGSMKNPGVGDGRISGSFSDSDITLDFVEYWHSPEKHVAYQGHRN